MPKVYLALYKGRKTIRRPRDTVARVADGLIRLITRSPYSHCEIALASDSGDYTCYSSSARDKGVRVKTMPLPADKWDLIGLPEADAVYIQAVFSHTKGKRYDWRGILGVPLGKFAIAFNRADKWFCSEWCACALQVGESWRYSPGALAKLQAALAAEPPE